MKIWYTIEKSSVGYTVWKNKEQIYKNHGGYGCSKVYSASSKKECIEYCEENNIKIGKSKKYVG